MSVLPLARPLPQPCQHAHFHVPTQAQATAPLAMLKLTLASFLRHPPAKLTASSSSNFHSKVCASQRCSSKVDGAREGGCKKKGCWTSFWHRPFVGRSQACAGRVGAQGARKRGAGRAGRTRRTCSAGTSEDEVSDRDRKHEHKLLIRGCHGCN